MSVKPIKPSEAVRERVYNDSMIETVNQLIKEKYKKDDFSIKQSEIVKRFLSKPENGLYNEKKILEEKLLDFEDLYEENGWSVFYNKPDYTEDFAPYFTFKPKV